MRTNQRLWTKEEILIAINLYYKLPFGQYHRRNQTIIEVAEKLGRTASSLAFKLSNLAALDPSLPQKGFSNYSKLDKEIWEEFQKNPDDVIFESEYLLNQLVHGKSIASIDNEYFESQTPTEVQRLVKTRINQNFFRKTVLASYANQCCISGVDDEAFLIASHIKPWREDVKNRLNPRNGLCLNTWYDKAFDRGFITIDQNYQVLVAPEILTKPQEFYHQTFHSIHQRSIHLPQKFLPDPVFLTYHRETIFRK